MTSTKYKLGELIEQLDSRNTDGKYKVKDVRGISTAKEFIKTKADMKGVSVSAYKIVAAREFAFVPDTSRRGDKMSLAYNSSSDTYIVSSISCVFRVSDEQKLLPDYLYIYFNRPEFDRFARFNSWGSARETFTWEDMCDIDIDLPPTEIQKKYVDIYKSMLDNQKCYERGLDDLKLTCEGYIEELRRKSPSEKIGPFLRMCNERNADRSITLFQGVNVDHVFTEPKRVADDMENGSIVRTGQFAFNKVMKSNGTKLPIALRNGPDCVVSNSYQVFEVYKKDYLLPKYLLLWMNRSETQRYAGFISFGTTRDIFSFDDLCEIEIPIPAIEIQRNIVNIFESYEKRHKISESLRRLTKNICPILIKGALEEANK